MNVITKNTGINWSRYKELRRAGKAKQLNRFKGDIQNSLDLAFAHSDYGGELIHETTQLMATISAILFRQLQLSAAEVAEAILLTHPMFCYYACESGAGADFSRESDEIIDRAMSMATQWNDDGYRDCLGMYEVGYTHFGRIAKMAPIFAAAGCSAAEATALEAGAAAAKAGADAMTFRIFTEPSTPTSANA